MRIKKLFKSESEYLDYVWKFIDFDESKIWREEDLPKLQPYFDNMDKFSKLSEKEWDEIKESRFFYEKCKEEYAEELFEIRDSISLFDIDRLAEFFLLEPIEKNFWGYDEDGNDIDEDGNIIPTLSRETIKISKDYKKEMSFPLYFIGWIDSSFDRLGDACIAFSDFVSLKEFEENE